MSDTLTIRPFEPQDVPALHRMMKALAVFEGYIDDFRVTEETLLARGLGNMPDFGALVATRQGSLICYAAYYYIPFTYDLRPTAVLKELYVQPAHRGIGAGEALFRALRGEVEATGAPRLEWLVLPDNIRAQHFYARLGGREDQSWQRWHLLLTP